MSPTLSVVLPCYNEEKNIDFTVRDVDGWMRSSNISGEIIVVNDGSRDGSADVLRSLAAEFTNVKVCDLQTNQGYGRAIRAGIDAATMDRVAFMDSDGQFHAEDLGSLWAHMDAYPFVTGRRQKRADSFIRNVFGKILGVVIFCSFGMWIRDVNCGMKMFDRSIWPKIRPGRGVEKLFNTEIFLRLKENGIPWYQVNVPHYPRRAGNPTGAKLYVILLMFRELWALKWYPTEAEIKSR